MSQLHYKLALSASLLALGLFCNPSAWADGKASVEAKSMALKAEILGKARSIRAQNGSRIDDINQRLNQVMEEGQTASLDADVSRLKNSLKEHMERQEFWDRLIFQIDTRFIGGDIREFLQNRLVEMAKVEAASPNSQNLWKVFRYTSDVLKSLPERKDDVIAVIEGYVRSTNPTEPADPKTYLSQQNYTNGTRSEAARSVDKDQVGELAERRLQELNASAALQTTDGLSTTIRIPAPPAPSQPETSKTQ